MPVFGILGEPAKFFLMKYSELVGLKLVAALMRIIDRLKILKTGVRRKDSI
jgi:hypothetical protein